MEGDYEPGQLGPGLGCWGHQQDIGYPWNDGKRRPPTGVLGYLFTRYPALIECDIGPTRGVHNPNQTPLQGDDKYTYGTPDTACFANRNTVAMLHFFEFYYISD